jgi:hypothetical protein
MKKFLCFLLIALAATTAVGQRGRQKPKLYGENEFQNRGWYFAPGVTIMPGVTGNRFETLYGEGEFRNDTIYSGRFDPNSRIGIYLEGGRHKFVNDLILIKHFDYGIHIKMLRGKEKYAGLVSNGTQLIETTNQAKFSETSAGAFINASNILQIMDNGWLHNSLGLNFDYTFLSNRSSDGFYGAIPQQFEEPMLFQLHYKLGFGWKVDPGLYIMPMVETPILNLFPNLDGGSTLNYFSSEYRPFIFSIRVMFLDRTEGRKCVGKDTSGTKPSLWGKEMKKYNR